MKKVLIIDDTKNIRLLLAKSLEVEGYQVMSASNGKEGLELLNNEKFNLIFLDVKLPEMSGTEVLRRMRANDINTPVIIITAYPTVKNAVECIQLGAITYLQKPFTAERLKSVLSQLDLSQEPTTDSSMKVTIDIIMAAIAQGNYEKAIKLIQPCFSSNPSDPRFYRLLAQAYEGLGDEDNATKFYDAAKIFEN